MADHDLLVSLRDRVPDLGERIERRNLYKRAVWAGLGEVPPAVVDISHEDARQAEREIADAADLDEREVVVDAPARPGIKESNTSVVVDGEVRRLNAASELVSALRSAERAQWRLGVYCPESETASVRAAACDLLELSPDRARPVG
jgi:hypothetical protein